MPEVAAQMNAMPKIVFSRTLAPAGWNNATLVKDDLIGTIRRMKAMAEGSRNSRKCMKDLIAASRTFRELAPFRRLASR